LNTWEEIKYFKIRMNKILENDIELITKLFDKKIRLIEFKKSNVEEKNAIYRLIKKYARGLTLMENLNQPQS
jgi:hypothetical protein